MNVGINSFILVPSIAWKLMDIFIIGAQKSGTTWLFSMLRQQPRFCWPLFKEMNYFSRTYLSQKDKDRQIKMWRSRLSGQLIGKFRLGRKQYVEEVLAAKDAFSLQWYQDLYLKKPENIKAKKKFGQVVYGESSVAYCSMPEEKIEIFAKAFPDATPILLIRDPLKRMISGTSMKLQKKAELREGPPENRLSYLREVQARYGDYQSMIPAYRRHFKSVHIMPFGHIITNPTGILRKVEELYGLDAIRYSKLAKKRNSRTGQVELEPALIKEMEALCAPQIDYLRSEFGAGFLKEI